MAESTTIPAPADRLRRLRESRLGAVAVLAVTVLVVGLAAYLVQGPAPDAGGITAVTLTGSGLGDPPVVGQPAQDFTATTVDGEQITLSGLRGHPVWLTFGASWCSACRAEAPDVEAAAQRARAGGAVVLEVFISEDAATVKAYGERVGLSYPKVADPDTRIASAYRVLGIPSHFFIDGSGVLRVVRSGSLTPSAMDAALAEAAR